MTQVVITTFYHFINLPNFEELKDPLLTFCKTNELKGTILLAQEGINSTISGLRENIDNLYKYLSDKIGIKNLIYKESFDQEKPFKKMKVNLKKEIVALGVGYLDVEKLKGEYVSPKDWDEFIRQEDVMLIDTRNKYETSLGSFEGAIDPDTETFRQFPAWVKNNLNILSKKQKIAMCCTGGIRCEKSTAYLKSLGFENVYHLEGGILKYFEDTQAEAWHGNCFVFDDRVALDKNLAPGEINCSSCNKLLDTDDVRALSNNCLECVSHG